jgi:gliding motility-associated-like protein
VANSGYPPLSYSINGGAFSSNPLFNNLTGGIHTISVRDGKGCSKDTIVSLYFQTLPSFLSSFNVIPAFCKSKNGSISINLAAGINPADVTASLNGLPQQQVLIFSGLDSGKYLLSVIHQQTCRYDTLITVSLQANQQPAISLDITDQKCLDNNGKIVISAQGSYGPYWINFNNSGISGNFSYPGLSPGTYSIKILDKDGCETDTSAKVIPYLLLPVNFTTNKTNPTCKEITGGSITVTVSGQQSPYSLKAGNTFYNNGSVINGLTEGTHHIVILNADKCPADTATEILKLELSPECDMIFVPSAFTPNNDGLNDLFKPHIGLGVIDVDFRIYNRWGELVFSATDRSRGWDGKLNGIVQPSAVFTWVITYKTIGNSSKRSAKGFLVLIR